MSFQAGEAGMEKPEPRVASVDHLVIACRLMSAHEPRRSPLPARTFFQVKQIRLHQRSGR